MSNHCVPLFRTRFFAGALLLLAIGLSPAWAQEPADLLLHNGYIFTADDLLSVESAVAIRDGRIIAVGGESLSSRFAASKTIDLKGRMVTPGFNDTHIHIRGNPPWYVDLEHAASVAEVQQLLRAKVAELEPGHWITGYGWAEGVLAEGRPLYKGDIDAAAPDNPVILARAGGHSVTANSLALQQAGIVRESPDPEGGVIERDAEGDLNGIVRERADLFFALVPVAGPDVLRPDLVRNLKQLLSLGITSIIDAGVRVPEFKNWEQVYQENPGELPRAALQIFSGLAKGGATPEQAVEALRSFGKKTGDGDEWLRVAAAKLWVDGGFAGPAAWTLEPYRNQPDYFGIQNIEEEDLYQFIRAVHADGWQMGMHAIGDAAIASAVRVLDRVLAEAPKDDHRHYLNHFTVVPPIETMRTMARRNIHIAQQPNFTWAPTLESRYVDNLEGDRLDHNNPVRTPMGQGIFVALGSDNHPIGPMPGLYASVTRLGHSGRLYSAEERLTMPEAIVGYTRNGAYLTFEENMKGTIEPGMLADLVVLDSNLLEIDPDQILGVKVDITVLGGKVVFER